MSVPVIDLTDGTFGPDGAAGFGAGGAEPFEAGAVATFGTVLVATFDRATARDAGFRP
jgi:hypothetical protein